MSTTARDPEKNIEQVLGGLPDFKNKRTDITASHGGETGAHSGAIAQVSPRGGRRGNRVLLGHVETQISAGDQRRGSENLHRNMLASMCRKPILTLSRIRRFARRTRDYCRAYLRLEKDADCIES